MRLGQQAKVLQVGGRERSGLVARVLAMLLAFIGVQGAAHAFTNSSLSGTYACKIDGSFLLQPFSSNTITFTTDGKGNIDGLGNVSTAIAVKAGSMNVAMGKFGTSQVPSSSPAFYFGELLNEQCNFLLHGGTYVIGPEGRGTLSLDWTAVHTNDNSPVDCTVDISPAKYQIVLTSTSAFFLEEADATSSACVTGAFTYANCGSFMSGTCTKQTGVAFPKTVPTP